MIYGPIAAYLVEAFPAKIRYTSLSLPYHIGNGVFGGLFFSSRIRHTTWPRDWSSDVCSSDLLRGSLAHRVCQHAVDADHGKACRHGRRSEERRVGKECRSRWSPDH